MLLSDPRVLASLLLGMLGLTFLQHASTRPGNYVRWLAGSALAMGAMHLCLRVLELRNAISPSIIGPLSLIVGVVSWAALLAGLQAYFRPHKTPPLRVFGIAVVGGPLLVVTAHLASGGWEYGGSVASSLLLVGTAVWTLLRWRDLPWLGVPVLAVAFLMHPLLLTWALANGLPQADFRGLMAGPLMVIYFVVITLIIERDAELINRQLALRAQAERDLIALADTLDDKVKLRTRQLEDMVSGLKSFAGMVSHDLRGPLGNAANLAHLAEQAMREGRLDAALRWVQLIERESRRASTMMDDLLRLAQVDQGPMNLAPVDLQALVGECVDALALQYPKAQQQVRIQDLPTLRVDAGMMRHVLLNLLSNALKFGHDLPQLSICVSARRLSDVWRFEVADNGPGFDPLRANELFKPFARLSTSEVPGSGIGLTVVRRVVERHGGQVGVQTGPGRGCVFWWTLPASDEANTATRAAAVAAGLKHGELAT